MPSKSLLVVLFSLSALLSGCGVPEEAERETSSVTQDIAGDTRQWTLSTAGQGGGYGTSAGTLYFRSRFVIELHGAITDRCPADSRGAYLRVRVKQADGQTPDFIVAQDANGCDNGSNGFTKRFDNRDFSGGAILNAFVFLCERDGSAYGTCLAIDETPKWSNPY